MKRMDGFEQHRKILLTAAAPTALVAGRAFSADLRAPAPTLTATVSPHLHARHCSPIPSPRTSAIRPQHVMEKLAWELMLMDSNSVWTDNYGQPVPVFEAFNAAVTAWHISDGLW